MVYLAIFDESLNVFLRLVYESQLVFLAGSFDRIYQEPKASSEAAQRIDLDYNCLGALGTRFFAVYDEKGIFFTPDRLMG